MALCFEITVNDEPPVTAGADEISVLVAALTYSAAHKDVELRAGGLISRGKHDNEHVEWLERETRLGDRITIRIVERSESSMPVSRKRDDPKFVEEQERKYYEQLKQRYESE